MTELALFDMDPAPCDPEEKLSADRRRTIRQADAIRIGVHPLSLALSALPLHPDASRDPDDRKSGPRCGGCKFYGHRNGYQKCLYGYDDSLRPPAWKPPARATSGAGTDLRKWWPGCQSWIAKDDEEAGN